MSALLMGAGLLLACLAIATVIVLIAVGCIWLYENTELWVSIIVWILIFVSFSYLLGLGLL